ncbi:MAG: malto-oligosyltrehalose trehalohydrolase [Chitinispirillaceae bacterium]|jgi:maltooligosyltrehalose trehalohydrolase|nr:malto-oligosyltrehalose trehalohydrolase [Chitinispirillaceae bacterium]
MRQGAWYNSSGSCEFTVWAPARTSVSLHILDPKDRLVPMVKNDDGYWQVSIGDVAPGARYFYRLDDTVERPDPASFYQPEGVHGPSAIVDQAAHAWQDDTWQGVTREDMILYEVHIGTFTKEGTFDAAIGRLDHLVSLGVTAIEIMPVSQFPGSRNWGYDGVCPYAVQDSYGGPDGIKRLVDACHKKGLAAVLDVVYNHLGPEGNYLWEYGRYFTQDKYRTPWGWAVNYDDARSDDVREYFIRNALYWMEQFHIDALRLDAVHAIIDLSAKHILQELAECVEKFNRTAGFQRQVIAESDLNDSRIVRTRPEGGYGLDAQWSDDFHHALHTVLTKENNGYYADFGDPAQLVSGIAGNFVYCGQYSAFRKRRHGNSAADLVPSRFVVFSQNHDQVGNRMNGDRLGALVDHESLRCAAAAVLLSPQIPLLFMGEEWGEQAPFLYFVSHGDPALIEGVRTGRTEEFRGFMNGTPPDPQDEKTFIRSKLSWDNHSMKQAALQKWYQRLIAIRKSMGGACSSRGDFEVDIKDKCLRIFRKCRDNRYLLFVNLSDAAVEWRVDGNSGRWVKILDSSDPEFAGSGSPSAGSPSGPVTIDGRRIVCYGN